MKNNYLPFKTLLLAAGSLVLVSSCQDYEPFSEQTVKDKAYTHEFEKQFGEIDPRQDWDLFGQLARHIGPATRATMAVEPTLSVLPTVNISQVDHSNYTLILPEINIGNNTYADSNLGAVTQDFLTTARHIDLIPMHWITTSTDKIGIYWYVDEDGEGVKTIMGKDDKLYYIKEFTIIEDHKIGTYVNGQRVGLEIVYENSNGEIVDSKWIGDDFHRLNGSDEGSGDPYQGNGEMYRDNVTRNFLTQAQMDQRGITKQYLRAHPIKITIPDEITEYGFWIKNEGSPYFAYHYPIDTRYSEWKLNKKADGPIEADGSHRISYTATFNLSTLLDGNGNPLYPDDKNQYLCFEDWINNGDGDLNDIIFIAGGLDDTNIKDNNYVTEKAILACEDLSKYDFDFNDVVLELIYKEEDDRQYKWISEITYVGNTPIAPHWEVISTSAKSTRLYVVPMAAGGAYETDIYIGENPNTYGEIHTLLKEQSWGGNVKRHEIINAGETYTAIADTLTPYDINPGYVWNVGNGQGQFATHLSQLFAEGFIRLHCKDEDMNAERIIYNNPYNGERETGKTEYREGYAPQMMLLPTYFEWPREEYHISAAYRGFNDWVSDITKTSWILDTQVTDSITDRGDLKPENPQEWVNPSLMEGTELPTLRGPYDWVNPNDPTDTWQFPFAIFVSLEGIGEIVLDDAKATLLVHYNDKPAGIYIDDANGNLLIEDNFGDGAPHITQYTLSKNKFNMAVRSGGIWIIEDDGNEFGVSKVEILIEGVTNPEKRHNLTVEPQSIKFEELNETLQIVANSTTTDNSNITYSLSPRNTEVVSVSNTGLVTALHEGSCDVIVTAKKGGGYEAAVARIHVVVDRTPTIELSLGNVAWHADIDLNGDNQADYYWLRHRTATTSENLTGWTNGATLKIHYTGWSSDWNNGGQTNFYLVENPSGETVAGNYTHYQAAARDVTYTLNGDQLASCKNSDGDYVFDIIYSEPGFEGNPQITEVTLTKIAN